LPRPARNVVDAAYELAAMLRALQGGDGLSVAEIEALNVLLREVEVVLTLTRARYR
jgi:hypothetical protein